jgi:hypothetical protein
LGAAQEGPSSMSEKCIYPWLYSPCGSWPLFQFLNRYTVDRTPWTGDQPVRRRLPTYRTTQTQHKANRHPFLEWDSNPRSPYSSGRRRFMLIRLGLTRHLSLRENVKKCKVMPSMDYLMSTWLRN